MIFKNKNAKNQVLFIVWSLLYASETVLHQQL